MFNYDAGACCNQLMSELSKNEKFQKQIGSYAKDCYVKTQKEGVILIRMMHLRDITDTSNLSPFVGNYLFINDEIKKLIPLALTGFDPKIEFAVVLEVRIPKTDTYASYAFAVKLID